MTPDPQEQVRYKRLYEREMELIRLLQDIEQRYHAEALPLSMELYELRESRDGRTLTLPDGRTFIYTGPRLQYKLPEES